MCKCQKLLIELCLIFRLHREALKQSATDPLSGKIDVGILTTGLSTSERKKRAELVANIKDVLKKKGKVPTVSWNKLYLEMKDNSQIVSIFWSAFGGVVKSFCLTEKCSCWTKIGSFTFPQAFVHCYSVFGHGSIAITFYEPSNRQRLTFGRIQ